MRKNNYLISIGLALIFSLSVSARDVIVTNQLDTQWVVIKQLFQIGVVSEQSQNVVIAPREKQNWVIRIPADNDYYYGLKVFVTNDPNDLSQAKVICKANTTKHSASWFLFNPSVYDCDENEHLSNQPGYDPENEPFTIVITQR